MAVRWSTEAYNPKARLAYGINVQMGLAPARRRLSPLLARRRRCVFASER